MCIQDETTGQFPGTGGESGESTKWLDEGFYCGSCKKYERQARFGTLFALKRLVLPG
jgi:hypothetical protein